MDNDYYVDNDMSYLAGESRPGRGCQAALILVLLILVFCCGLVFGTTVYSQINPGFRELLAGLLSALLSG